MLQLMRYAEFMAQSTEEQFCWTAADVFLQAQRNECKYGFCACLFVKSEKDGVQGLARNIASALHARAVRKDELGIGRLRGAHCGGAASTLRILRRTICSAYFLNPDFARDLLTRVWCSIGPELVGRMRSLRSRARARLGRVLPRWIRQTRRRIELTRILDGVPNRSSSSSSSATIPLLLLVQLLSAPMDKDGRRDIHDAARTVHKFLAL
jgi:hypothetical protein